MLPPNSKKMSGDSYEMRDLAARICKDYLHGAWKKVNGNNIGFKHISGGLSNLLYHISLPQHLIKENEKDAHEPKEVLIRIYGQTHGEGALEALITESVIFTLLSERGLGPKLHGIFPGGRIEQYINARPLLNSELADPKLSRQVAQKMAQIHSMEVPLHKKPDWLWNTTDRWLRSTEKILIKGNVPQFVKDILDEVDLRSEVKWLKERLEAEKSPVVFCHNDMQEGNILLMENEEVNANGSPKIVLIDFEYCSYNYRAFDIANHFLEWIYDYKVEEHPFYTENMENYPTEKQRMRFVQSYLEEKGSNENPAQLLREVETFSLASHFFWGLWAVVNADTSQIPFGYWEYFRSRFTRYFQLKEMKSHGVKRSFECLNID